MFHCKSEMHQCHCNSQKNHEVFMILPFELCTSPESFNVQQCVDCTYVFIFSGEERPICCINQPQTFRTVGSSENPKGGGGKAGDLSQMMFAHAGG